MDLFVNGEKIDIILEDEKTVGDVLSSFEKVCVANDATTVGIKLNGTIIGNKSFDDAAKVVLSDDTKIELSVLTSREINVAFDGMKDKFAKLADEMEQVPVNLQAGKDAEVNAVIRAVADDVDYFCHLLTLSALFPEKYGKITIDGKSVADFFAELPPILSEFEQALKSKDTVMTGDLAEYELSPRLRAISKSMER